jgi:IclR family transcriptional regulator, acetate operon repressor
MTDIDQREAAEKPNGREASPQALSRRVTEVLYALAGRERGLSVRAIADMTGNSRSSTHRILQMLAEDGYAEQRHDSSYVVGPKLLELAARVFGSVSILRVADSIMVRLSAETGESSYLAAFSREDLFVTFIHRVDSDHPVRHIQPLGARIPLHAGAVGKAVLAACPDIDLAQLDLTPYTERTPRTLEALEADVQLVRERGFAVSIEERVEGVAGVAAPLLSGGTVVGGLTVAIPVGRVPSGGLDPVGAVVKEYAGELGAAMQAAGIKHI